MADNNNQSAMPHSIEAEEAVVGAILIRQSALHDASAYIVAGDFYSKPHRMVFQSATRIDLSGQPVDLVTIVADLNAHGELQEVGGAAWVAELGERVPSAANVASYARVVREKAIRRRLIQNANELVLRAKSDSDLIGVEDVLSGLVTTETSVDPVQTMPDMVASSIRKIEEVASGKRVATIPTGLTEIDRLLGGIPIGWQCIFLARPRIGKSAIARTIAHNALRRGEAVGMVDLEMRREGLLRAILSRESGIPSSRLRMGQIRDDEWPIIADASARASRYPLYVHDGSNDWGKIKLIMRRWVDLGCKMIVIDYLSKVEPEKRTGSMFIDVGKISYEAHDFAHKFDVALLMVVQQNREAPKEKDKRPKLYSMRESGRIEESADLVFALYSPNEFDTSLDPELMECWILKAKDSATGMVELRFIAPTMEFADWDGGSTDGPKFDADDDEPVQSELFVGMT